MGLCLSDCRMSRGSSMQRRERKPFEFDSWRQREKPKVSRTWVGRGRGEGGAVGSGSRMTRRKPFWDRSGKG